MVARHHDKIQLIFLPRLISNQSTTLVSSSKFDCFTCLWYALSMVMTTMIGVELDEIYDYANRVAMKPW